MIQLYTIDGCSRCYSVKLQLNELAIPIIEKNLLDDPHYVAELIKLNNEFVIPALVIKNTVLTGSVLQSKIESLKNK